MNRTPILVLALLCAGCAGQGLSVPDTARPPAGAFGGNGLDPDMAAVELAANAFADPSRTAGRPAEAARASAAVDYLAGELNTAPRWACVPAIGQMQILQARTALRHTLSVAPDASSQVVVDSLASAANALSDNDRQAALSALSPSVFTAGPEATLRLLGAMPYMPVVNVATLRVENEVDNGLDGSVCAGEM